MSRTITVTPPASASSTPPAAVATAEKMSKEERKAARKAERAAKKAAKKAEGVETEPKVLRVHFSSVAPSDALNAEGQLVRVPVLGTEFNSSEHKRLKAGDFTNESLYLEHTANLMEARATSLVEKANELRAEAKRAQKVGDPETRKKLKRVAKMAEQLKLLQEQLAAEGIDISDD